LGGNVFVKEVKKWKWSETPPEEIRAGDEARYAEQEKRAAKRADYDIDYIGSKSALLARDYNNPS